MTFSHASFSHFLFVAATECGCLLRSFLSTTKHNGNALKENRRFVKLMEPKARSTSSVSDEKKQEIVCKIRLKLSIASHSNTTRLNLDYKFKRKLKVETEKNTIFMHGSSNVLPLPVWVFKIAFRFDNWTLSWPHLFRNAINFVHTTRHWYLHRLQIMSPCND